VPQRWQKRASATSGAPHPAQVAPSSGAPQVAQKRPDATALQRGQVTWTVGAGDGGEEAGDIVGNLAGWRLLSSVARQF
ncbi:MAG TPA: hypothetical protein VJ812_08185, partial [Gemmatimonadaceae bacterium]|nr:hypothetical protein [Gemmatimonadaceae bacterium]